MQVAQLEEEAHLNGKNNVVVRWPAGIRYSNIVGKSMEDLIGTEFDTGYLAARDSERLVYHHADVDIRPMLKRDGTIRPSYELTVPEGIPLDEHQRIAERARLGAITKAPRDKRVKRDESGTAIQTIKRQVPQTTFGPLKRLVLADQEEASDDSPSKKRRRTRSTGLPPLVLPSGSSSSATTPSRSPLKIPATNSPAAGASRQSTPSVDSDGEPAKPKTKEIVITIKNRPELAENLVVKRFH
jgi:hypothetical protein